MVFCATTSEEFDVILSCFVFFTCSLVFFHIVEQVLLYDEPTAGLDPIASTVVEDLIRHVHMKGEDARKPGKIASYVVVTHQHSTIRRAVDRLAVSKSFSSLRLVKWHSLSSLMCRLLFLHEGKVVWQGMTDEFMTSASPIVQQVRIVMVVLKPS